jgi:hypothetical protein
VRVIDRSLRNFGLLMFLTRLFGVLFIVFSTYNPTGWSLWHWFEHGWPRDWTLLLPLGLLYVVAYVLLTLAAFRALRPSGVALVIAFLGSIVWVLVDAAIVPLNNGGDLAVILLYMSGAVLAIGVSWASAWVMLTGQVIVDDLTR